MPSGSSPSKLRVVLDTNVYISGLIFRGSLREVLELMRRGVIEVVVSPFLLDEVGRVLERRFEWSPEMARRAVLRIRADAAEEVEPTEKVSVVTGKDADNRILECAVAGRVPYLITGDKRHLLPLEEYRGVRILAPAEFLRLL